MEASLVASAPAEIARLSQNSGNRRFHRDLTCSDRQPLAPRNEGGRGSSPRVGLVLVLGVPAGRLDD
jgi:hypothetical protein